MDGSSEKVAERIVEENTRGKVTHSRGPNLARNVIINGKGHRENSEAPGKRGRWDPLRTKRAERFYGLELY